MQSHCKIKRAASIKSYLMSIGKSTLTHGILPLLKIEVDKEKLAQQHLAGGLFPSKVGPAAFLLIALTSDKSLLREIIDVVRKKRNLMSEHEPI